MEKKPIKIIKSTKNTYDDSGELMSAGIVEFTDEDGAWCVMSRDHFIQRYKPVDKNN